MLIVFWKQKHLLVFGFVWIVIFLVQVYGGDDGWVFIEEVSYILLVETILEKLKAHAQEGVRVFYISSHLFYMLVLLLLSRFIFLVFEIFSSYISILMLCLAAVKRWEMKNWILVYLFICCVVPGEKLSLFSFFLCLFSVKQTGGNVWLLDWSKTKKSCFNLGLCY